MFGPADDAPSSRQSGRYNRPYAPQPGPHDPNRPYAPQPGPHDPNQPYAPQSGPQDPNRPYAPQSGPQDPNRPYAPQPRPQGPQSGYYNQEPYSSQNGRPYEAQAGPSPAPAGLPSGKFSQYLVIIEGDKGKGSGFIANLFGKPTLFTNSHVLSGNSKIEARLLKGTKLDLKELSVAENYDVSIFQQNTTDQGLEIMEDAGSQVNIGDDVVVLGNSLGAGVVTESRGRVTGVGPELIEMDAEIVPGNSGSPVIHVKTGKVIGIATFTVIRKLDGVGQNSKFDNVERRFAYRVDNVPTFVNTTWNAFAQEAALIGKLQERTDDIWNFAADISRNKQVTRWEQHTRKGNHLAHPISNWRKEINRPSSSRQQITNEKKRLISSILHALRSDISFVRPEQFGSYHRKKYESMLEEREMLKSYFQSLDEHLR